MTWCPKCYQAGKSDKFHINQNTDEDGIPIYDCPSDKHRYNVGIQGAQFMVPFQCDLCIFRLLFKRNPTNTVGDYDHLTVIRRMNLDSMWAREPSTTKANLRSLIKFISTCETLGMEPNLPPLGPFPFSDDFGYSVAFSMLIHSLQGGRHDKSYTQFATIRKQRSAFSNLYFSSRAVHGMCTLINSGSQSNGLLNNCPTYSRWFQRWSLGCETRMGYILKQNQAISIDVMKQLIESFKDALINSGQNTRDRWLNALGLTYSVITFFASLRGSEGLKVNANILAKYWSYGLPSGSRQGKGKNKVPAHVIIPLMGRFKGEQGERCHLIALAEKSASGVHIRRVIEILMKLREDYKITSSWLFTDLNGQKVSFEIMNDIVLEKLEELKENDHENRLGLSRFTIREDFSINRSFRRGSSTTAQINNVPSEIIELMNRWKKFERAKGRRAKMSMMETYADIELLLPTMIQYSAML